MTPLLSLPELRERRGRLVEELVTGAVERLETLSGQSWGEGEYELLEEAAHESGEDLINAMLDAMASDRWKAGR